MKRLSSLAIVLWFVLVGFGIQKLARYETTPGLQNLSPPERFPEASKLTRDPAKLSLLFFVHPKCPCSRASLNELSKLVDEFSDKLSVHVVFIRPSGVEEDWADTPLRASAEKLQGIEVSVDQNEFEANLFNARTSGTALLYDETGQLKYNGGLTRARGVEGDNLGRSAIKSLITNDFSDTSEASVYGCPLKTLPENE